MHRCKLCEQEKDLVNSHTIPKFVSKWLKESSATGYLRGAINPNLRKQDTAKEKLLCSECEIKFSNYESFFSKNIFYPFLEDKKLEFEYDEKLINFVVSLSWRVSLYRQKQFKNFEPKMYPHLKAASLYWRNILYNNTLDTKYEHHIFFLDYIADTGLDIDKKRFNTYIMRGIDATIGASDKEVFVYTKFPGIIILSYIFPNKNTNNVNTKIRYTSKFKTPQTLDHPGFDGFLKSRLEEIKARNLSKKQIDKISRDMQKNPDRALKSKSFQNYLENLKYE